MSPKDDRWGVHAFGSGDKRLHYFSIFGDRTPLLQRPGQRAEGGKRVQVSRLTEGARRGGQGNALGSVRVHACVWELLLLI